MQMQTFRLSMELQCSFLWMTHPLLLYAEGVQCCINPTQPIPHCNYCTHAISEGVTTGSQNRSFPELKSVCSQNKPC